MVVTCVFCSSLSRQASNGGTWRTKVRDGFFQNAKPQHKDAWFRKRNEERPHSTRHYLKQQTKLLVAPTNRTHPKTNKTKRHFSPLLSLPRQSAVCQLRPVKVWSLKDAAQFMPQIVPSRSQPPPGSLCHAPSQSPATPYCRVWWGYMMWSGVGRQAVVCVANRAGWLNVFSSPLSTF